MKSRLPGVVLLFTLIVAPVLPHFGSVVVAGIENPTCELIRPSVYRLNFQALPETGPVEVFASSRPDQIDSPKPLLTIRKTPAEVSVPDPLGRVYFHLKPAAGSSRVVSVRRLPL
jgi:hypothetical protein